ncbi:MAG: hypothetical protein KDB27_13375 [Planctomycetales bacterium]|nr:hypothetical protein [Planctomycetales bacterium]
MRIATGFVVFAVVLVLWVSVAAGQSFDWNATVTPNSFDYLNILQDPEGFGYHSYYLPRMNEIAFDNNERIFQRQFEFQIREFTPNYQPSYSYQFQNSGYTTFGSPLQPIPYTGTWNMSQPTTRFDDYGRYYPGIYNLNR